VFCLCFLPMQKEKLDFLLAILSVSAFVLLLIATAFILFRIFLKKKNTLLLEKERMSIQFEQTLLRSKLEIQEQTFTHIGHEIHDNIGQVLSFVRLNLNTLETTDEQKINQLDEQMGKAITDLRNLSHSLDADYIRKNGWVKAAERLFQDLGKTDAHTVTFSAEKKLPALGDEKPIILFRMIQEILNNIVKHAKAKEIKFEATPDKTQIVIVITDNGKGFDRSAITAGAGLQNLESRATLIDAKLYIHSVPGSGTRITISINTPTVE
jgi:signal transduction histidine kinase